MWPNKLLIFLLTFNNFTLHVGPPQDSLFYILHVIFLIHIHFISVSSHALTIYYYCIPCRGIHYFNCVICFLPRDQSQVLMANTIIKLCLTVFVQPFPSHAVTLNASFIRNYWFPIPQKTHNINNNAFNSASISRLVFWIQVTSNINL